MTVPLTRVTSAGINQHHLKKHGITRDEAKFLRSIVKAVNGDLDGYNLTDPMTAIKDLYDIDEDKLCELGYLKKHVTHRNRVYYTVTHAGQQACRMQQEYGPKIGDLGDDTPHRVGLALTRHYYESFNDIRWVNIVTRRTTGIIDAVAHDYDGDVVAAVEVEAGRTTADPGVLNSNAGINDYASIRNDYRKLAATDGQSVWVARNHEIAANLLRAISSGDDISIELSRNTLTGIESGRIPIHVVNEKHIPKDADGIDRLMTFGQLWNRL